MNAIINKLIDKKDTFEIIRLKIASILKYELENQKKLAKEQGKDDNKYNIDIYVERINPWLIYSNEINGDEKGALPLVNITFESDNLTQSGSMNIVRQKSQGTFYIDCYAFKNKSFDENADEASSKEADRISTIIRNILMYSGYLCLGLEGLVVRRYITKREKLTQNSDSNSSESVAVCRLTLIVDYAEYSFEEDPVVLESIIGECLLNDTGKVIFNANYISEPTADTNM